MTPSADIRGFLQQQLVERCRQNPRYSLRAFAKHLHIEPSALSKILNGKRKITDEMLERLGERLGFGPKEIELFRANIPPKTVEDAYDIEREFRQLTLDTFEMISNWYNYAILQLTATKQFVPSAKWVAKVLGISILEVNSAVDTLTRLKLLEISPTGRWINRSGSVTTTGSPYSAAALRKFQRQLLEKAIVALETIPIEKRDQTSTTMAIPKRLLPEARERIKKFRRSLAHYLQSHGPADEVYQLVVSLYPLTDTSSVRK